MGGCRSRPTTCYCTSAISRYDRPLCGGCAGEHQLRERREHKRGWPSHSYGTGGGPPFAPFGRQPDPNDRAGSERPAWRSSLMVHSACSLQPWASIASRPPSSRSTRHATRAISQPASSRTRVIASIAEPPEVTDEALEMLARRSGGDARVALGALERAAERAAEIDRSGVGPTPAAVPSLAFCQRRERERLSPQPLSSPHERRSPSRHRPRPPEGR